MADPRSAVSFEGINGQYATYAYGSSIVYDKTKPGGSLQVGLAVKLSADDTVELTTDGSNVEGKLISVEPDFCKVQFAGGMSLPSGASATLTIGEKIVGDLDTAAEGYIRAVASGTAAELAHARGRIINNNDTAAVVVML